ncbi:MAG: 6-pyruvoyl trahydropterin synthase family protein [Gemmatimonadales bacterium]
MSKFKVTVSKDYLGFAAAHFITLRGHMCEALHGHNYRVAVTVEGPLDPECHFVVDFAVLKTVLRRWIERVDHRVLLPATNPKLSFREEHGLTSVDYSGQPSYQFPTRDCAMLPMANTTAELLAGWFAERVRDELAAGGVPIDRLEIEVEESPGQSATFSCAGPGTEGAE